MMGNVWEWTASDFQPYPGFVAGPYKEYSAPWFGDHKVLRRSFEVCVIGHLRFVKDPFRTAMAARLFPHLQLSVFCKSAAP